MTAIELLCQVIAGDTKVGASTLRPVAGCRQSIDHGYLKESGVVSSIVCTSCDQPHDAAVVFANGRYGCHCPDLGFTELARADVVGVVADGPVLVERLGEALGLKRQRKTPLRGRTWRVGVLETEQGDVAVYLHPRLRDEEDAREVTEALSREVITSWRLIATAEGRLAVEGATICQLSDLVDLNPETGQLLCIADPRTVVGVPIRRKGGAPNRFEKRLLEICQGRLAQGVVLPGLNEEAREMIAAYRQRWPGTKAPSFSTVKRNLLKFRSSS